MQTETPHTPLPIAILHVFVELVLVLVALILPVVALVGSTSPADDHTAKPHGGGDDGDQ